jgi:chromate reductase, NAD(P)H dehydrogenase (quinone)
MKLLALCGSLRKQSRSLVLLKAAKSLAMNRMEFRIHEGLGNLPLFDPDIESSAPESVHSLWDSVSWSDAVIIASPEYAHGVTGTMKNTLDWLVGYIPFAGKPVAVFNPTYRSEHADEMLKEILRTMAAQLIPGACVRIASIGSNLTADEMALSDQFTTPILSALTAIEDFTNNANAL